DGTLPMLDEMLAVRDIVASAQDPDVVTSFLQQLAYALILSGRYEDALPVADEELDIAERYRLRYVIPSARSMMGFAELGLGNYGAARELFDVTQSEADELRDLHNTLNARMGRARIFLAHGHITEALSETLGRP